MRVIFKKENGMEFTGKERLAALNYSIYMIASSYFHSARCLDAGKESQGFLLWRLLGPTQQYRMEDPVIELMERRILKFLPEPFQNADVQVRFLNNQAGIRILGLGYRLDILPVEDGRYPKFAYDYKDLIEGTSVRYAPTGRKTGGRAS